jgi:hypothetical protein
VPPIVRRNHAATAARQGLHKGDAKSSGGRVVPHSASGDGSCRRQGRFSVAMWSP